MNDSQLKKIHALAQTFLQENHVSLFLFTFLSEIMSDKIKKKKREVKKEQNAQYYTETEQLDLISMIMVSNLIQNLELRHPF